MQLLPVAFGLLNITDICEQNKASNLARYTILKRAYIFISDSFLEMSKIINRVLCGECATLDAYYMSYVNISNIRTCQTL